MQATPEIRADARPIRAHAIGSRLRVLLASAGMLAALASVGLAATGNVAGHPVAAALAAALASALWMPAFTMDGPRVGVVLATALGVGILASAADPALPLWNIPHRAVDLGVVTGVAAGSVTAVYMLAQLAALAGKRRPISLPASCALVTVPFLFNALLALDSRELMAAFGGRFAAPPALAPWLGRGLTLWLFNLLVVVGTAWVIDQRGTRSWRIHAIALFAAAAAVATPAVADVGSSPFIDALPSALRLPVVILSSAAAQAGLWGEVFLVTGVLLDALRGLRPTPRSCTRHWCKALVRGAIFGGLYIALTHAAAAAAHWPALAHMVQAQPVLGGAVLGAVLFPLARTLLETFDGSDPFFARLAGAYADSQNALRGLCVGAVLAAALNGGLPGWSEGMRFLAGFGIGAAGYAGADLLRDLCAIVRGHRQRFQAARIYGVGLLLGGGVGGALAWYFDMAQLAAVTEKLRQYVQLGTLTAGEHARSYVVYPLFSKWGAIDVGIIGGGVRLLWSESMAGIINWAIAAPLFGINLVMLTALFQRSFAPLRELFSGPGLVGVVGQTVRVLRWGPWMAPIIFTFLRMSPEPSWYNQDGLVHTLAAIAQSLRLSPDEFRHWSLQCFLGLLAYDWLRVLIWFDHMGLRVATLVNLSFVGGDALDERAARFIGQSARSRVIPEGVRRFLTWAPLLLPFYLPRGPEWDYVWAGAETLSRQPSAPLLPEVEGLAWAYAGAGIAFVGVAASLLVMRSRLQRHAAPRTLPAFAYHLSNGQYSLELNADGSGYSHVESTLRPGFDVDLTRRPDDPVQMRGKWFWLREIEDGVAAGPAWSLSALPSGHPDVRYRASQPRPSRVRFVAERGDLRVEAEVEVAAREMLEVWSVRLRNASGRTRTFELTSYRELALAATDSYRRAPAFAAMHVGTFFVRPLCALLAHNRRLHDRRDRSSAEVAFHAVDVGHPRVELLGYEDSRLNFIGDGTLREPSALAGRSLRPPEDEGNLYTFDPIASLRARVHVPAGETVEVRFIDGYAEDKQRALRLIAQSFGRSLPAAEVLQPGFTRQRSLQHLAFQRPGSQAFTADGLEIRAPAQAARPWTHVLANELGHGAVVGADGAVFCFNRNAEQNALTPFVLEALPAQTTGQLLALVDVDSGERLNASFTPWRHAGIVWEVMFGLGYVRFRAQLGSLELEETLVVPPDAPVLVRSLRVRNRGATARRLRAVAFADMVLAQTPVDSLGRIEAREDASGALLLRNGANDFRKGWAFVATNLRDAMRETVRARFLGSASDIGDAHFLTQGGSDLHGRDDGRRCAAFASPLELHPDEERRINLVMGQAADGQSALDWVHRFRDADGDQVLSATRAWWLERLRVLRVETDRPEFDRLVNIWLPYQVLSARLWGRCGPQQRGGGFGFRDQLQDVLPLVWTHPRLAREQILLHAAQQFREGDVLMWWHASWDGGTGIGARTAVSDAHLWLPYVAGQYVAASGDESVLRESVPFLEGRTLPAGKPGVLLVPRPSRDRASLYEHCRRAIERSLTLLSPRGLPLIGSGDWNDGLNALGLGGRGESVWVGFFLHHILRGFAPVAAAQGDPSSSRRWADVATQLREALELAWRDDGYARATSDEGEELRFASCLMAAWPALSAAVAEGRAKTALESALRVLEKNDRVLLLAPPFDEASRPYPGAIAEYPPGVRENGAQYSHGASWTIDAWLLLAQQAAARGHRGEAERCHGRAWEIWWKISPLSKTDPRYGLPPHQQAADVYDGAGYAGCGGWAWYTGAAARMLHAAYGLLGIHMEKGELRLKALAQGPGAPRLRLVRFQGKEIARPPLGRNH